MIRLILSLCLVSQFSFAAKAKKTAAVTAPAATCEFSVLKASKKDDKSSVASLDEKTNLVLEDSMDHSRQLHGGPLYIEVNGKKQCQIDGGNFSGVSYNKKSNLLLIEEYSGSCGSHRVVNPKTCKNVGLVAKYCGVATISDNKLVNEPPCESTGPGQISSCSMGKIFNITKSCNLELDKKASMEFTKEKLQVALSDFEKAYIVEYPRTSKAKILSESK